MLFLSDRMTSASGSIGGTVFSHNRFGMYTRARRTPVNPNSTAQQAARAGFGSGSAAWRSLAGGDLTAWNEFAAETPVVNALGQTVFLTGHQWFTATYALASRLNLGPVSASPQTPGLIPLADSNPSVAADASAQTVVVGGLNGSLTASLGLFVGDPISPGATFYNGPYKLEAIAVPAAGTATFAGVQTRLGSAMQAGDRLPIRIRGFDAGLVKMTTEYKEVTVVVA